MAEKQKDSMETFRSGSDRYVYGSFGSCLNLDGQLEEKDSCEMARPIVSRAQEISETCPDKELRRLDVWGLKHADVDRIAHGPFSRSLSLAC